MQTETKELGGAVDNHLQEGVEDVHGGVDGDVSTEVANSIEDTALEVLALPPELPIVIDEQALEDILGVCSLEQQPNTTACPGLSLVPQPKSQPSVTAQIPA